jgi:signal transduction histidine kinase
VLAKSEVLSLKMFSSIRLRLLFSYGLLVSVVLCVVTFGVTLFILRNPAIDRQVLARLNRSAEVLLNRQDLPAAAPNRLEEIADRLDESLDARVLFFTQAGELLVDTRRGAAPPLDYLNPETLNRQQGSFRDADGGVWLYSSRSLPDGRYLVLADERPRRIRLLFSDRLFGLLGDELFPPIVRAGLIALLVAVLLAFWLSRWIAAPLQRMADAAVRMAEGERENIPLQGPNEARELASALNDMSARVEASRASQRDFVANVSHELKTPLTSIQGFAQAILDGTANTEDELQQAAEVIYAEAGRMHRMVLELLDLARLDSGIAAFERRPFALDNLLEGVVQKLMPLAGASSVDIQTEIGHLPVIVGDPDRLAQVFTNLIDNAIKHSPAGEKVTVRAQHLGDQVDVFVEDRGPGIAEGDIRRIFERFYQVDKSRRGGSERGTGLGLTIAREIVLAHNGDIQVYNNASQNLGTHGAVFVVKLPLAPTDDAAIKSK